MKNFIKIITVIPLLVCAFSCTDSVHDAVYGNKSLTVNNHTSYILTIRGKSEGNSFSQLIGTVDAKSSKTFELDGIDNHWTFEATGGGKTWTEYLATSGGAVWTIE